ncbi:MAG: hypothetical protein E7197_08030 [Anaerovibrio sp.]|uniref:hypothetical protein n=1 Tax=Anaerovibrio sp. TaxID=1872532 RepID=UPI0025C0C5AA|nr:hypothetical protein [Anaerovibrio sp.]MBE6099989.1 hypothetical protein [Anaerovibrio sp.]
MNDRNLKIGAAVLVLLFVLGAVLLAYNKYYETDDTIIQESQTTAETPAGVQRAAEKAGVTVDSTQAKAVAKEIKYIYETQKEPVYILKTTGAEVQTAASTARKEAKADFSIITDKNNPTKEVSLEELQKEKAQPVELNQYNIQAYKSVIRTISITPDLKERGVRQVNFSIARKVTKDGQYVGVGVGYDIVDKRALVNLSYSW